jgi:selenocysteine lyase/cysteine desulfurase
MPPHAGPPGADNTFESPSTKPFVPKPGADRFHLGMPSLLGLAATRLGLEVLTAVGMDTVEAHVLDLTGYCICGLQERGIEVLTPADPQRRGGVIAASIDDAPRVAAFLRARRIDVYGGHTYNRTLRIDPHVFNNREDIDRLLAGLDEYMHS